MRRLPLGMPKVMVSTVASGQVAPYVGSSDIMMLYSVADVQGLNAITEQVLGNAAHALAGMIAASPSPEAREARRRLARPADRHHHVRRDDAGRAGDCPDASKAISTVSSSTRPAPAAGRWRASPTRGCSPASST